jgi:hypothetical protein
VLITGVKTLGGRSVSTRKGIWKYGKKHIYLHKQKNKTMGQMYIQDELTEEQLDKIEDKLAKIDVNLYYSYTDYMKKFDYLEERFNRLEKILQQMTINTSNEKEELIVGKRYIQQIEYIEQNGDEFQYQDVSLIKYNVKLIGSNELLQMTVRSNKKFKVNDYITFTLGEENKMKNVKIKQ